MRMILAALLLGCVVSAQADRANVTTRITGITVDKDSHGVCSIELEVDIREASGLDCNGRSITFSCDGEYVDKDVAYRMLDLAQMAFALERDVQIKIDDSIKSWGLCLAERILVK